MKDRDQIHKQFLKEHDPVLKSSYHTLYKEKTNRIVSLIRISKKQHFAQFFEEHHSNVKKNGIV